MLSALRGILQRWVGMTTEVQTVEGGEAPAVPAAANPACSADYPATAATRRLKRPGPSTSEAADMKRPRTAPATPIDNGANAGNPPVGKLTVCDPSDPRLGAAADIHTVTPAGRPSTTASAPAALNRALRSQPSVSTSSHSVATGSCSANGAATTPGGGAAAANTARHCGAISGVVAAPQLQPTLAHQQLTPQRPTTEEGLNLGACADTQLQPPLPLQQPQHTSTRQLMPAVHRFGPPPPAAATTVTAVSTPVGPVGGGGGGENAAPRSLGGHTRHGHSYSHHHYHQQQQHSQSHSYSHGQDSPGVLQLQQHPHHHHDALEEQVFSPAFHRPSPGSAPASTQPSPSGSPLHAAVHRAAQGGEVAGPAVVDSDAVAVAAAAAAAASVEVVSTHHHGPACTQLHAIDLNVVDGVDVDTEDDELGPAGGPATAAAAAAAGPHDGGAAAAAVATGAGDAALHGRGRGSQLAAGQVAVATESGRLADGVGVSVGVSVDPKTCQQLQLQLQHNNPHELRQQPCAQKQSGVVSSAGRQAARGDHEPGSSRSSSISGGAIEAVGEELSSSSSDGSGRDEDGGVAAGGQGEEGDFYECENDENAPVARSAASVVVGRRPAAVAAVAVAAAAVTHHQRLAASQQQHDAVLVASAPRGFAATAAVAAVQAEQQQHLEDDEDDEEEEDDDALLEFDPLVFIKQLPPLESCVPSHRPVLLPLPTRAMARRKTLVLDLDETLVHSSLEAVDRSDFSFPVMFNGTEHQVYVRQRPHLRDFMVRVAALFEVVVFTASQRIYAERLLDILDPQQQLVRHRIYRDSCVVVDGNYLKDLSILGRDLAHTVIVDNSPQAFGFQVDNGIPIESWYDDDNDMELIRLLPFLESLAGAEVEDVRPRIRSQFRLRELIDRA